MSTFQGKVVVVTGANSGIGEAAAVTLEEAGATVFGVVRRKAALESARSKHPRIKWLLADVAVQSQVREAIESVVREAGRLDVLINNAAVFQLGPLEAASEELVRSQFEINVFGLSYATQAALPALKASRGQVLNVSSAAAQIAVPGGSHYAATKAAVESLTKSWALELASAGVRVNAIAPGPVETPMFDKLAVPEEMRPAVKNQFVQKVPLGRIASAAEVVRWIVAVTDPENTWMTGHVLAIDGGMSLT